MIADTLISRDLALWQDARGFLDVRSNDVHTLISYRLARALLAEEGGADAAIVLPAILLHDVGWKRIDPELLSQAVGPNATRPDLVRAHEVHGVEIAGEILRRHQPNGVDIDAVLAIIDRHDTGQGATSPEDALVKDADKAWRFTPHGVATISGWFGNGIDETLAMLEDFVMPTMLTPAGRIIAGALLAAGRAEAQSKHYLKEI
ncbi:HD domain-containing protein [Sulfitobacter sp. M57]|uniref:HD domain-containing protein n=1 Tax=unclassified Sulfitobacter TaxID=196795 RepID=UPI0023E0959D|nr:MULTISPECIES: HD domain-containing protein [unclassified Sulfitobacter]MDF3416103.1 HD domain-containing protein [Sulfitobacter sp. KE5]MDF3423582.1 HD domain-containing protein [Sulfitobacter sp. KE43]MDF3434616.1 HD domain-containing protein [Sulfitobacter sp. KE42]MDF3460288.1 HD domain-containing protein [Sulfitobacter sp. S74]MDF3464154.1 HD domain-containing protein [Sulfitobacter sp. Ks18]